MRILLQLGDVGITPLNQLYQPIIRNKKPAIIVSKKAKENKKILSYLILRQSRQQKLKAPLKGNISLHMDIIRPNKKAPDADALLKSLMDVLQGIVYNDDKQVVDIRVRKFLDQDETAINILIKEI